MDKQTLVDMLRTFTCQRPGLEFGNYGNAPAYRADLRGIACDRREALILLAAVEARDGITLEHLQDALKHSFSGRLSLETDKHGRPYLDYCTGQYWPTEYRRAVAAVCATALWTHWRNENSTGDSLHLTALRTFGRGIQRRWFN